MHDRQRAPPRLQTARGRSPPDPPRRRSGPGRGPAPQTSPPPVRVAVGPAPAEAAAGGEAAGRVLLHYYESEDHSLLPQALTTAFRPALSPAEPRSVPTERHGDRPDPAPVLRATESPPSTRPALGYSPVDSLSHRYKSSGTPTRPGLLPARHFQRHRFQYFPPRAPQDLPACR